MQHKKNTFLLLTTALIWGFAFVAQSVGMDYIGPFTFNMVRFLIGSVFLIPCIYFLNFLKRNETHTASTEQKNIKPLLIGGLCCGIAMAIASSLQQFGIAYTTVGKAGFITALYIVIVPILGIFLKKKPRKIVWFSVFLALIGLYFLCMTEQLTLSKGDIFVLLCAFAFSIHILLVDHFSPKVNGVKLSCIQFLIAGLICLVPSLLFEHPDPASILSAWAPILYAGILSCGVAYTFQIIGQKNYDATIASLILSLESVFSVLAGWIILHQQLSIRELIGCCIVFIAIILVQLPSKSS